MDYQYQDIYGNKYVCNENYISDYYFVQKSNIEKGPCGLSRNPILTNSTFVGRISDNYCSSPSYNCTKCPLNPKNRKGIN